jgi:hypothetical protein
MRTAKESTPRLRRTREITSATVYSLLATLILPAWPLSAWAQSPAPQSVPQQPAPAATHSAEDLSARATDPTASLMSFGFVNDFHTSFIDIDDNGFEFRFQPVVPFRALGVSNILRVVVPYQASGPGNEGLKDVSLFDLVIVPIPWGRLAIGPVMSLHQSDSTAESKFAIGRAVVVRPVCSGHGDRAECAAANRVLTLFSRDTRGDLRYPRRSADQPCSTPRRLSPRRIN